MTCGIRQLKEKWNLHFSNEGFIRAWMFVPREIADLCESGVIQAISSCHAYDEPTYRAAYKWMIKAMDHAGLPSSSKGTTPWWCWIQIRNDFGDAGPPFDVDGGSDHVLFELKIPADQILISDFCAWHAVINYWLLADSEAEDESFDLLLTDAGLNTTIMRPVPEPFNSMIEASWQGIFDLGGGNDYWRSPLNDQSLQGVFWNLTPEMIIGRVAPRIYVDPLN